MAMSKKAQLTQTPAQLKSQLVKEQKKTLSASKKLETMEKKYRDAAEKVRSLKARVTESAKQNKESQTASYEAGKRAGEDAARVHLAKILQQVISEKINTAALGKKAALTRAKKRTTAKTGAPATAKRGRGRPRKDAQ